MKNFTEYLVQNFAENTVNQYIRYVKIYTDWLEVENLTPQTAQYTDIIKFIENQQNTGKSTNHINRIVLSIRHYYKYLQTFSEIKNIAEGIFLKTKRQKIPSNLLTNNEIQELYEKYEVTDLRTQRNKTILGLLVFQAVTTQELHKLLPEHIKLEQAKIYIPGGRHSNSRKIELNSKQIIVLHKYLTKTRPEIIRNLSEESHQFTQPEQLFFSMEGNKNLKPSLLHFIRALQKINSNVLNAKQIRFSVISHKLKTENLRQVQYFAGHRYVSSTERYKLGNIDKLKKDIDKYHPLQ